MVDIYPTLADVCGLTPPANLPGRSLKPLLDAPTAPWDKPAFTQVWRGNYGGYSVRTQRWRYTMWGLGAREGEELYDYESDMGENQNLSADSRHSKTKAELRALVEQNWSKPYLPSGGKGKKKGAGNAGKQAASKAAK